MRKRKGQVTNKKRWGHNSVCVREREREREREVFKTEDIKLKERERSVCVGGEKLLLEFKKYRM